MRQFLTICCACVWLCSDCMSRRSLDNIGYLPEKLPTAGESDGWVPDVGSFCLYVPWGNLS